MKIMILFPLQKNKKLMNNELKKILIKLMILLLLQRNKKLII